MVTMVASLMDQAEMAAGVAFADSYTNITKMAVHTEQTRPDSYGKNKISE